MRKRVLIGLLLSVLALPTLALIYLLYSEQGLRMAVAQLDRFTALSLRIDAAQGRLAGPLRIGRLELRHPRIHVDVDGLRVDLAPSALLAGVVSLAELSADRISVRFIPGDTKSDEPLRFLPGRLRLHADRVALKEMSFVYAQNAPITADRLAGRIDLSATRLQMNELQLAAADYDAEGELQLLAQNVLNMHIAVDGRYRLSGVDVRGHAEVRGTPEVMEIRAKLHAPSPLETKVKLSFPNKSWRIDGHASSPSFDLMPWLKKTPFNLNDVALTFGGNPQALSVTGNLSSPQLGDMPLHLTATGNFRNRTLEIARTLVTQRNGPGQVNAAAKVTFTDDAPTLDAQAQWRALTWPLGAKEAVMVASETGELSIAGGLPYDFTVRSSVSLPGVPNLAPDLAVTAQLAASGQISKQDVNFQYELARFCKRSARQPVGQSSAPGSAQSRIVMPDLNGTALATTLRSSPLPSRERGRERTLSLSLSRRPGERTLDFNSVPSVPDLSSAAEPTVEKHSNAAEPKVVLPPPLDAQGHSQTDSAVRTSPSPCGESMSPLRTRANGRAQLAFETPLAWQLELALSDFDPGIVSPQFPGNVTLQTAASGRGFGARGEYDVQLKSLRGDVRGQPVSGQGGVRYAAQTWTGRDVRLSFGATRLTANGKIGQQSNFVAALHSDDLKQLDLGLAGTTDAELRVSGSRDTPHVVATLTAPELSYGEWRAKQAKIDADVDMTGRQSSRFALGVGRVSYGGYALDTAQIAASGTPSEHRIDISTGVGAKQSRLGAVKLQFNGGYRDRSWSGSLSEATVTDADHRERTRLSKPADLTLSPQKLALSELCYAFDSSSGCAQGHWTPAGDWRLLASIAELPLSLFNSEQVDAVRYGGHVQANIDMHGAADDPLQGHAEAQLIEGSLAYTTVEGREQIVPVGTGRVELNADGNALHGALKLEAGTDSSIEAEARIAGESRDKILQWPLTGALRAHTSETRIVPLLFAAVDRAGGVFDANLQVSGSLAQPRLQGELRLDQGELALYQLNLALRELTMLARINDNRLYLEGKGRVGDGTLSVDGNMSWSDSQPFGNLRLKGENLLVADLPEYRVVASPDLDFMLEGRDLNIVGEILIPSARLKPENVSGAVQISDDARMINERNFGAKTPYNIVSEVRIRLGDDVQVDALGLQGKLGGYVGTTMKTNENAIGRGELNVADGRYEAYGQKLEIKRGRLIFDVSPLDNPGLDIQAERKVNEIIVGLNVRGLLREPRLQFYSTPSMSQTQIVSYLIVGKPFDELQGSEAATVRSASNTLALQGGGYLAAQLGRRIGLEQVGVETDSNNQSSLVLGKFLSPRLFISYGISLTEAINTLKLRYTISDKWVLKTEAGAAQSADVEFTIER